MTPLLSVPSTSRPELLRTLTVASANYIALLACTLDKAPGMATVEAARTMEAAVRALQADE